VLESARLRLARLAFDDAGFILELLNEPDFLRYIGDKGVRSREDAHRYLEQGPLASYARFGYGLYRVGLRPGGEPIGICGVLKRETLEHPDLGFALLARFRCRGYGLEAADAVMRHARHDLGLKRLLAITTRDNVASIRLLERLGFGFERMAEVRAGEPELKVFARDLAPAPVAPPSAPPSGRMSQ